MIRYNSPEVSEKLFNFAMNQAYYETTVFSDITIALAPGLFLTGTAIHIA